MPNTHTIVCRAGGQAHTHTSPDPKQARDMVQQHYTQPIGRTMYRTQRAAMTSQIDDQLAAMLLATRDGRFAVRPDDFSPWQFLRLSRPTKGRHAGWLRVQSQHSDMLSSVASIRVGGGASQRYLHAPNYLTALRLLVCDPVRATIEYGRRKNRCSRCGKTLTDDRSRFYAIGPECEKYWPDVLRQVEADFGGPYPGPGWDQ